MCDHAQQRFVDDPTERLVTFRKQAASLPMIDE